MSVQNALQRVQDAAQAEARGDVGAHKMLLEEIHRLQLTAETPNETLMRMRFRLLENLCVRIALELGVLQAIAAEGGKPLTASELSRTLNVDELLIVRIMRLVTYAGICEETASATYASNARTPLIVQKGNIGGEKHHTDLGMMISSSFIGALRSGRFRQFPEGPDETGVFEYHTKKGLFAYFEDDPEQKEAFDDYMQARRTPDAPRWFDIYPAAEELNKNPPTETTVTIVDVGGGLGHEITKFRQRNPHLPGRLILQDLASTFQNLPSKPQGVELMTHDFFTDQPVKNARFYYLSNIMHDWPDKDCAVILSKIVAAMDATASRVLINEYVLPDTQANRRSAGMDILMMMFVSGMERSRLQWEKLLASVNLEIVKIWSVDNAEESIIEAKVRS